MLFCVQMQNFFVDHCHDAFGCMAEILGENFSCREGRRKVSFRVTGFLWRDRCVAGTTIWSSDHFFVFVTECESDFCFCCFRNMEGTPSTCGRWKASLTNWSLRSELTWLMWTPTLLRPVYFMTSPFRCPLTYSSETLDAYSALMSDVVQTVPPELLGGLLHEELTEQRDRMLFFEGATGGALAFVPFSQSSSSSSQRGCLLYPGNKGLDCLSILLII